MAIMKVCYEGFVGFVTDSECCSVFTEHGLEVDYAAMIMLRCSAWLQYWL